MLRLSFIFTAYHIIHILVIFRYIVFSMSRSLLFYLFINIYITYVNKIYFTVYNILVIYIDTSF